MSIDITSEMAIFKRIVLPAKTPQGQQVAQALTDLDFSPQDVERMEELAEKARQGTLTPEEERAISSYERVGHYLSILQSIGRKAKRQAADSDS